MKKDGALPNRAAYGAPGSQNTFAAAFRSTVSSSTVCYVEAARRMPDAYLGLFYTGSAVDRHCCH
jgi:hypothetical protein